MRLVRLIGLLGLLSLAACTSVGSLGVITKSSVDPVSVIGKSKTVKELGPAEGRGCRYFALAVIPSGNSDIQTAVDRALRRLSKFPRRQMRADDFACRVIFGITDDFDATAILFHNITLGN